MKEMLSAKGLNFFFNYYKNLFCLDSGLIAVRKDVCNILMTINLKRKSENIFYQSKMSKALVEWLRQTTHDLYVPGSILARVKKSVRSMDVFE